MADGGGGERQFLGNFVKNKTKYGATTKPMPKFKNYVKHTITRSDTLMGIALKYGATVEVIKRENKLWTNDSLFLREHIYVPVTAENSHMVKDDWEIVKGDVVRSRTGSDVSDSSNSLTSSSDVKSDNQSIYNEQGVSENPSNKESQSADRLANGMDFFNKYDDNIAQLKTNLAKLEKSSSLHYRDNPLTIIPRRNSDTSRSMYAGTTRSSPRTRTLDNPESPVLVIRSNTRSKSVASTLQRTEQLHDRLYEL